VKLTIYRKMMIGFLVIIFLMSIVNGYVLLELRSVSKTAKVTLTSDVQSIDLAKQLQTIVYDEELYAQKYLISRDNAYYALFIERNRRFDEFVDSLLAVKPDDLEFDYIHQIQNRHDWFVSVMDKHKNITLSRNAGSPASEAFPFDSLDVLHTTLDRLIRLNQKSIDNSMASVGTTTGRSSNIAFLLTVCAVLAAITLALIIARTLTQPINILKRGTEQIARGSFGTINVTTNDEFAILTAAFNDMSEKLKTVNERKAEMMQRISHELRTPLQAMLSAHFLLTEQRLGPINKEQLRVLTSIRESIDKLTNFSNQFLDIAKIEAGMMEYSFERADLISLVRPSVEDAELIATRKDIRIDLTFSPVPPVMLDNEKISQVVTNLLSNAIKYTPKGGNIIVNVAPCEIGVRIAVQDSGVGIAADDLPKIFTKFYQAKNVGKASVKGTGLGLALVKALTEGHGGVVSVTSTVGMGTTFTVELPHALEASRKKQPIPVKAVKVAHA